MTIAQQLPGLEPLSLSNNKNSRLKKTEVFPFVINAIPIKPTIHQNSAVSKTLLKVLKSLIINMGFGSWKLLFSS